MTRSQSAAIGFVLALQTSAAVATMPKQLSQALEPDAGVNSKPLLVVDANGSTVGRYGPRSIYIKLSGVGLAYIAVANCQPSTTLLCFSGGSLYFTTSDCTGTAYVSPALANNGALPATVTRKVDGTVLLHVAESAEGSDSLTVNSSLQSDGIGIPSSCVVQTGTKSSVFPSLPPIDITTRFVEPMKIR